MRNEDEKIRMTTEKETVLPSLFFIPDGGRRTVAGVRGMGTAAEKHIRGNITPRGTVPQDMRRTPHTRLEKEGMRMRRLKGRLFTALFLCAAITLPAFAQETEYVSENTDGIAVEYTGAAEYDDGYAEAADAVETAEEAADEYTGDPASAHTEGYAEEAPAPVPEESAVPEETADEDAPAEEEALQEEETEEYAVAEDYGSGENTDDSGIILIEDEDVVAGTSYASERPAYVDIEGTAEAAVRLPSAEMTARMRNPSAPRFEGVSAGTFTRTLNDSETSVLRKAADRMGANAGSTSGVALDLPDKDEYEDDGDIVLMETFEEEVMNCAGYYDVYKDSFTSDAEKRAYDMMVEMLRGMNTAGRTVSFTRKNSIWVCDADIADIASSQSYREMQRNISFLLSDAVALASYDNPEYYWTRSVGWKSRVLLDETSGSYFLQSLTVTPEESFPGAIGNNRTAMNKIDGIYGKISSASSADVNGDGAVCDYEFLLSLHDYICGKSHYDYDGEARFKSSGTSPSYLIFTPDPLFNGNGGMVCDGYARAFKIFCDRRRIPNFVIVNPKHAWNAVKLGNTWYMVDATWDDGLDSDIAHVYFLCGLWDTQTDASGSHYISETTACTGLNIRYPEIAQSYYPETAQDHRVRLVGKRTGKTSAKCLDKYIFTYRCDVCGKTCEAEMEYVKEGGDEDPQTLHTYGAWKTTTAPTYTKTGMRMKFCRYCGCGRYEVLPALDPNLKVSKPSNRKISVKKKKTYTIKASSKTSISYTTSNKKIATVSSKGVVKGVAKGSCTVTVKSGTKSVKIKVTVTN